MKPFEFSLVIIDNYYDNDDDIVVKHLYKSFIAQVSYERQLS